MDFDDVWLLPSGSNLDFDISDWRAEAEAAFQRQRTADRFFKGLIAGTVTPGDADAFFDHLREDGIEPDDYLAAVKENIEVVIADGRTINTDGLAVSRKIIT